MGQEMQQTRYGIYVDDSGLLATSICHAKDGNAGKGECRHFSFSDTPEEADRKLTAYLSDRMDGILDDDQIDGTAGDYLDAFRNWLILEKGYNPDGLQRPKNGETLLHAWFDDNRKQYSAILQEASRTSLLSPMFAGAEQKDSVKRIARSGVPIRVISDSTLDGNTPERVASDTRVWLELNGISQDDASADDDGDSTVSVISSGPVQHDASEIISHGDKYVKPAGGDGKPDERQLEERYADDEATAADLI